MPEYDVQNPTTTFIIDADGKKLHLLAINLIDHLELFVYPWISSWRFETKSPDEGLHDKAANSHVAFSTFRDSV